MPLSEDFLEEVKRLNDISSVMSGYVQLKRAGRDSVCLCPFHSEKTPSCHVFENTQSFYCFGCGAGGDVITFIRRIENLDYLESVRFLAQRAGLAMPEDINDHTASIKTRLLEINREAARFFRDSLLSPQGKEAMDYLINRGLSPNIIKRFGLGYAPDSWNALRTHMKGKGFSEQELVDAALLVRGQRNTYDKFRHRVMFPIIDRRGNVIAFGGRALSPDEPAKYINSDETPVFKKRESLFALNFAKSTDKKYLILCEGYMDVIALHQAGFSNAVATLGTAITADQARLIRLYGEEAVIAYDADNAGQAATLKAINLLSDAGVNTRVLQLKDAKDPDEYIKKFGAQAFLEQLEDAGGAVEFELKRLSSGLDLESAADRTLYLKKAVELLASITSELERTVYISEVARQTQTLHDNVKQLVEAQIKRKYYAQKRNEERQLLHPRQQPDKLNPEEHKFPTEAKAEKGIIAYLLHSPELLSYITQTISEEDFPTSFHKKVFEILKNKIKHGESVELSALNGEFSTEEMGKIIGIQRENALLPFTKQRLSEYLAVLKRYTEQKHKKDPSQMTPQELQDYIKALSEKKVPKGTEHERRQ